MKCKGCGKEFTPTHINNTSYCKKGCNNKLQSRRISEERKKVLLDAQKCFVFKKFESKEDMNTNITLHDLGYVTLKRQILNTGFLKREVEPKIVKRKIKRNDGALTTKKINSYCLKDVQTVLLEIQDKYYKTMRSEYIYNASLFQEVFNRMEKYIKENK